VAPRRDGCAHALTVDTTSIGGIIGRIQQKGSRMPDAGIKGDWKANRLPFPVSRILHPKSSDASSATTRRPWSSAATLLQTATTH
jgi:hypothetical protein